jgi:hypothetical protein
MGEARAVGADQFRVDQMAEPIQPPRLSSFARRAQRRRIGSGGRRAPSDAESALGQGRSISYWERGGALILARRGAKWHGSFVHGQPGEVWWRLGEPCGPFSTPPP